MHDSTTTTPWRDTSPTLKQHNLRAAVITQPGYIGSDLRRATDDELVLIDQFITTFYQQHDDRPMGVWFVPSVGEVFFGSATPI